MDEDIRTALRWIIGFVVGISVLVVAGMCAAPQWGVYSQRLAGNAELQRAEFNRRVRVVEAEAELASADLKRRTDITRAEGIARANEIIGKSITDEYLLWRWVDALHESKNQIIYVPTEANLPILEAMRDRLDKMPKGK